MSTNNQAGSSPEQKDSGKTLTSARAPHDLGVQGLRIITAIFHNLHQFSNGGNPVLCPESPMHPQDPRQV